MALSGRVLLVNGQSETAEVLKAVLEPRGLTVDAIEEQTDSSRDSHQHEQDVPRPNVIVLHQEAHRQPSATRIPDWNRVPRVVIGSARIDSADSSIEQQRYLQSPFHYGELIQAVENLLESA